MKGREKERKKEGNGNTGNILSAVVAFDRMTILGTKSNALPAPVSSLQSVLVGFFESASPQLGH